MCMRIPSFSWVNVVKNAWFAPAKRPRCYPVRVLGFDQPDFQGFTSQSSRIFCQPEHWGLFFPAGVLGFYQTECWDFTRRSAGVLPAGVLGFYQTECWGFTSRSAEVFYQPECWNFTSRSAGIFTSRSAEVFYQPECWGFTSRSAEVFNSQSAGVLPARVLGSYQPGCWGFLSSRSAGGATSRSAGVIYQPECWGVTSWTAEVLPIIVLGSFISRSARFFVVLAGVLVLIPI